MASNLVPGDTNGALDVFVRDRQSGKTTRVSLAADGAQGNSASGVPCPSSGGRFVGFESLASNLVAGDSNESTDVFVHDRQTLETTRVSVDSQGRQANGSSAGSSMGSMGRYVAFESLASHLVVDDTTGCRTSSCMTTRRGDHPDQRRQPGPSSQRWQLGTQSQRRRPLCRFRLVCVQPGGRRHQPGHRRLRA